MNKIIKSQNRIESKYISNSVDINQLLIKSIKFGFIRTYPKRLVYSLYYDDDQLTSVKDNLAGITPRRKYRLRWYSYSDKKFFGWQFEIKVKTDNTGHKRIIKLPNNFDMNNFDLSIKSICKLTEINDDEFFPNNLKPQLLCNYSRDYYEKAEGHRLTIDSKLKFTRVRVDSFISNLNLWENSNFNIMEIKFDPSNKSNLLELFRELPFSATRCSKYLLGHAKLNNFSYL